MLADEHTAEPKRYPASRLVASAALIVGAGWMLFALMWTMRLQIAGDFISRGPVGYWVMPVMAWFLMSSPGIACFVSGRKLHARTSIRRVREAVGALTFTTIIGAMVVTVFGLRLGLVPQNPEQALALVGTTSVLAFAIYAFITHEIFRHDRFASLGFRDVLTKKQLWGLCFYGWVVVVLAAFSKYSRPGLTVLEATTSIAIVSTGALVILSCLYLAVYWAVGYARGR